VLLWTLPLLGGSLPVYSFCWLIAWVVFSVAPVAGGCCSFGPWSYDFVRCCHFVVFALRSTFFAALGFVT